MTVIRLREIERADLALINRWRSDRGVVDGLGSPFRYVGREVDERWYEQYMASRNNNVRLAICPGDAPIVGVVYLLSIDWISRNAEFAIWVAEVAAQGKKIGETATRLALDHAFDDLNLERVYLYVLTQNERAIRLYRKVGFRDEGTMRRAVFKGGAYRDLLAMAVLRSEYEAARSRVDG